MHVKVKAKRVVFRSASNLVVVDNGAGCDIHVVVAHCVAVADKQLFALVTHDNVHDKSAFGFAVVGQRKAFRLAIVGKKVLHRHLGAFAFGTELGCVLPEFARRKGVENVAPVGVDVHVLAVVEVGLSVA